MGAAIDLSHLPERVRARAERSGPSLLRFCPDAIPYQRKAMRLVRREYDYAQGVLEILLSGSYGSAKSVLLAHLAVTHCLANARARVAIVRRSLPDLKETLFKEIIDHLEMDRREGNKAGLVEGRDYFVNRTRATIRFRNGSEIVPVYWSDRKYTRARSKSFSMVLIEEAVENDEQDKEGFEEIKARLGRLPHVKENVLICATNPGSPTHWLYDYFIVPNDGGAKHPTRHVFYSRTEDNPYLPLIYIQGLRKNMDQRRARRYLDGEWIELTKDQVYYAYSSTENFRNEEYEFDLRYPIRLSWDFNIGVGKPLSMVCFQYIDDVFHWGKEIVVEGMRTLDSLEELAELGILDIPVPHFIVHGDAAGKNKDTRNRRNDYEIIMDFLQNYKTQDGRSINVVRQVPLANPTLRSRHNRVNSYCFNAEGERRFFVYAGCPTLHKGMRLVELKKGSDYIEDDSKAWQHVTTAAGYGVKAVERNEREPNQGTREL